MYLYPETNKQLVDPYDNQLFVQVIYPAKMINIMFLKCESCKLSIFGIWTKYVIWRLNL